jgi:hypothetical protein
MYSAGIASFLTEQAAGHEAGLLCEVLLAELLGRSFIRYFMRFTKQTSEQNPTLDLFFGEVAEQSKSGTWGLSGRVLCNEVIVEKLMSGRVLCNEVIVEQGVHVQAGGLEQDMNRTIYN